MRFQILSHAGLVLSSYHFGPFLDSTVVAETEGRTLFNANDAKVMGAPLRAILARHTSIDFVLCSHSSANARACCLDGAPVTKCLARQGQRALPLRECAGPPRELDVGACVASP